MNLFHFVSTDTTIWGLPPAFLDIGGVGPYLIPIAGMAFVLGIIIIGSLEKTQKEKLRHETIRRALEKGQTVPSELLDGTASFRLLAEKFGPRPRDDRRAGLICLAIGIGIFLFFHFMRLSEHDIPAGVPWLGAIPALIGVALLINWALERHEKAKQDKP